MRPVSARWRYLQRTSHTVITQVDAYFEGRLTAAALPLVDGSVTFDDTAVLRRRLTFQVPVETAMQVWDPGTDPHHPLACFGQRVHVRTGMALPGGGAEYVSQGWYLIDQWRRDDSGQTITVSAVDLAQLVQDARFYFATSPGRLSYADALRVLATGAGLESYVSPGLRQLTLPGDSLWERERIEALDDLASAWSARWFVDDAGRLAMVPAYTPVTPGTPVVLDLVDGHDGTVVSRQRGAERGRIYNAVCVTGAQPETEDPAPTAVAEIQDPQSPIRVDGPYGRRPRFYSSDLISNRDQAEDAAASLLARYSAAGRAETVLCVPDPAVELGDVVRVQTSDGGSFTGRVQSVQLPLFAAGGPMQLTVSTVPRDADQGDF